jgi:hypothetical protein
LPSCGRLPNHQAEKVRRARRRATAEARILAGAGEHYFLVIELVRRCARTRAAPAGADETVCKQMPSIFVRTLNGSVSVPQEGSVQNLKEQIEARSGIAAESVRLAYNGHILQDDELLEELESQITLDL